MPESLLEQVPSVLASGRKQAEKKLESILLRNHVELQTCEVVLPSRGSPRLIRTIAMKDAGMWGLSSAVHRA